MIVGIRGREFIRLPTAQIPGSSRPAMRSASPAKRKSRPTSVETTRFVPIVSCTTSGGVHEVERQDGLGPDEDEGAAMMTVIIRGGFGFSTAGVYAAVSPRR